MSFSGERSLSLDHYTFWLAYQPSGHFWMFQAIIGGVLLVLAVLCAWAVMWRIRHA